MAIQNNNPLVCNIHLIDLECMGGRSAHRSNWYCPECIKERQTKQDTKPKKYQPYVIKEHKLAELANELTIVATKYQGCQCMRSMISATLTKALKIPQ